MAYKFNHFINITKWSLCRHYLIQKLKDSSNSPTNMSRNKIFLIFGPYLPHGSSKRQSKRIEWSVFDVVPCISPFSKTSSLSNSYHCPSLSYNHKNVSDFHLNIPDTKSKLLILDLNFLIIMRSAATVCMFVCVELSSEG